MNNLEEKEVQRLYQAEALQMCHEMTFSPLKKSCLR